MKRKFKNGLMAVSAALALSCVAVGGIISINLSDGVVDTNAHKIASLISDSSVTPVSNGNVYYVSPSVEYSESDSVTHAGTLDDPCNIRRLLTYGAGSGVTITAGDTIVCLPGSYSVDYAITLTQSGTYDNYITVINASDYTGYTGDTGEVVFTYYNMDFDSTNRGIQINGDYWYWKNVDICGAGDNGMYIAGCYNVIEDCEFYNNRDTGLQLGRAFSSDANIDLWPSYNLIKNCTSYNNYDNETYGENADGFAAKLTVGYGNIFDGCIAYRNSDDGWDLYAKADSGNIGAVIIYNCVAFENGYLMETQATNNARFGTHYNSSYNESATDVYTTRDGDGNGFKLGGGSNEGDVILYNCMSFNNRMHGVTDNSNPGTLMITGVTSYNNGVNVGSTGAIDYSVTPSETCANIDVARWDYSYNVLSNVLSVIDSAKTGADAYRGSAENSMFSATYITDNIDSDSTDSNKKGEDYSEKTYNQPTKSIFKATPELTMGTACGEYDSTTNSYANTIHSTYRNADGSINMGDILALTDTSGLISENIGCTLNLTGWDAYTHYTENTVHISAESEDEAVKEALKDMLYVPVNTSACYQDFDVVTHMIGYDITWTSSNSAILSVGTDIYTTVSSSESVTVTVYRPETDTEVTLTATATVGTEKVSKEFKITVVAADYEVGDIVAEGVEDDQIIIDQYRILSEPAITVYDGSDYNGKTLSADSYDVATIYKYAESAESTYFQVADFTTSKAGVYQITKTVSIKGADTANDATKINSYTYSVYISSSTAKITLSDTSITVNKNGFILDAVPSNATGILYVYVSDTAIEDITAETVVANGIATEYRTTAISVQYSNANSAAYYIYYAVGDLDGKNVSEVYTSAVQTVEISDTTGFDAMLSASDSTKIYVLTADIDYGTYTDGELTACGTPATSATFSAVLNGMGYTVKNVSATQAIFMSVKNGTIMNIKFDNINITSTEQKSGIIGEMNGGYIYNVAITDVKVVSTNQRTGGLIGQIIATSGTCATTYVQNVSLINSEGYYIESTNTTRAGGLVGYIQAGSTAGWNIVYISDCYVSTDVNASQQLGSIVGALSGRNDSDYLEITNCVAAGTLTATSSTSRIGGMLGYYETGSGTLYIDTCISMVDINFGGEVITAALKNASGIVGGYSTSAICTVTNCYAPYEDYNAEYEVGVATSANYTNETWWTGTVNFNFGTAWELVTSNGSIVAPYITLNFLAVE